MRFIRNIEINYFRCLYRVRFADLRDVNVLSGRNDVGKSNVLKALNLFFNGRTDWQTGMDFYRDFSSERLVEVRKESIKGRQFISVMIEFCRPSSYKGSLPEFFRVKRTWYRFSAQYGRDEWSNLDQLERQGKLPSTLETARRCLQLFLNKLHYEYVPAVKDRGYFEHILSRLQSTLLDVPSRRETDISNVAANLADHIQGKVATLQDDFERATGIRSAVTPPPDLGSLFQAFGVATDSSTGVSRIPLALRGDGMQARYVLSVLRYICESSNDFFVWGFEEPENSLEYGLVADLAKDFENRYSKVAQVIVTTHSPALTSLRSDRATCFRVFRDDEGFSRAAPVWPEAASPAERKLLHTDLGLQQIQEELHAEYVRQKEALNEVQDRLADLEEEKRQAQKPLVLTEGKHDRTILETSWEKCRPGVECPFILRAADPAGGLPHGGAGGAVSLAKMIGSVLPGDGRITAAVFDRDREGLKAFNGLSKSFSEWQQRADVKVHVNRLAFAVLLPIPTERQNYARDENLSMEFLFPDTALEKRTPDGRGLVIETPEPTLTVAGRRVATTAGQLQIPSLDSFRQIRSGKDVFANEIVPTLEPPDFKNLDELLGTLLRIVATAAA